jgi:hypothetical protein
MISGDHISGNAAVTMAIKHVYQLDEVQVKGGISLSL